MKNSFGQFDEDTYAAFQEAALDKYDFTTCQRPDGSKYGSNGRCIKGSETSPASKDDKKKSSSKSGGGGSSSGEYRTRPKGAIESDMKKLTSSGAMNQKGAAGVKAREEHSKLKAELNKPLKGANSKSGGGAGEMSSLKSEVKKLGNEYEKLRKDKSPKAEARKKQIMSDVNKNMNKQKDLQKKMDAAAKSQSPKAPRDSSPAGAQRRAQAASNARD